VIPAALRYERPRSLAEALERLAAPGARALAGGQSLLNVLKLRAATVDALVDVSRLDELRELRVHPDGSAELGAGVTYDELDRHAEVRSAHPYVSDVAAGTVDQQVRCRGTIGGNVCYADPSSNFPPLLLALDAMFVVAGPGGEREVAAGEFFRGPFRTAVEPGELLRAIRLPPRAGRGIGYQSIQIAPDSWALARAVVALPAEGEVRVVVGCLAPVPMRQPAVERVVDEHEPGEELLRAAAAAVEPLGEPISDVHASGRYRLEMARVVTRRALVEAFADAETT
jgi:aerobic carbon-monoxide dehydrogenase medium subunit